MSCDRGQPRGIHMGPLVPPTIVGPKSALLPESGILRPSNGELFKDGRSQGRRNPQKVRDPRHSAHSVTSHRELCNAGARNPGSTGQGCQSVQP